MFLFELIKNKLFFKDRVVYLNLLFSTLMFIAIAFFIASQTSFLKNYSESGMIPLHYTIYFGIDLVAPWYEIWILPLFGLLASSINLFLAYTFYNQEKQASYALLFGSSFVFILLFLATAAIILYL